MYRVVVWLVLVVLFPGMVSGQAERLFLVVNADSESSQRIAREYAALREIPEENVFPLRGVPGKDTIGVDEFRNKILKPVLRELEQRELTDSIDIIAYSSDFPTRINLKPDSDKLPEDTPRVFTATGSITGLTFLYQQVLSEEPTYMSLQANQYFALSAQETLEIGLLGPHSAEYQQALSAYRQGGYARADEVFSRVLAERPGAPEPAYWLARARVQQGKLDDAFAMLSQAISNGWSYRAFTAADGDLGELRDQPRFKDLIESLPEDVVEDRKTRPFRHTTRWNRQGFEAKQGDAGQQYYLSVILAVTQGRGTTEEEALEYLRRSAAADGSAPSGTVYYMSGGGVRTRTREPGFQSAVDALKLLGVSAEIVSSPLPRNKAEVAGVMTGQKKFDWSESGSTLLPGAIAENLTSHGGNLRPNASQTPLSEFLRHGAAASSGTVTEPFALQQKFPHPHLHVHYARGSTLAEAFFLSVQGPYQLLVVGDPLCRPWRVE